MLNIQNNLPQGWANAKLKEVSSLRNEKVEPNSLKKKPYISLEHIESGSNHLIDHGYSEDVKSLKSIFYAGDVLYGKLRPYLNKVCQPNFDGVCSTDILVFGPSTAIENRFLLKLLSQRNTVEYANSHAKGINLPRISPTDLGELIINLPPFNEQKRIVNRIDELQARNRRAREALEAIPDLLDQLRQTILAAAFRGDLTKEWREKHSNIEPATELLKRIRTERRKRWEEAEREKIKTKGLTEEKLKKAFDARRKEYKEPFSVDASDLPELPYGWCWASIDELSSLVTKGSSPNWQGFDYVPEGVPFVRSQNVLSDKLDLSDIVFLPDTFNEKERKSILAADDVLVNIVGASIGRAALAERQVIGGNLNQAVALIRLLPGGLSPELLVKFLLSTRGQSQIHGGKVEVARANLSLSDVAGMAVPLPPIKEQNRLSLYLKRTTEYLDKSNNSLNIFHKLFKDIDQTILTKAFRGELVPQDTNDEPASILLERIRQEKASAVAEPKVKRKGKKMKRKQEEQRDVLTVLRKSGHALTPEEVFTESGFDEASVDIFYEQLRAAIDSKKIREIRKGKTIRLEAVTS